MPEGLLSTPIARPIGRVRVGTMSILIVLASVAYFAIGFGFTLLSLHELATAKRNRFPNRLFAWSNLLFWLPMVFVVGAVAFYTSRRPAREQAPTMATRASAILAERRSLRRMARQG